MLSLHRSVPVAHLMPLPPSAAWLVGHRRYAQTLVLLAMVLACATEAPAVAVAGVLCLTLRFLIDKFHHLQVR